MKSHRIQDSKRVGGLVAVRGLALLIAAASSPSLISQAKPKEPPTILKMVSIAESLIVQKMPEDASMLLHNAQRRAKAEMTGVMRTSTLDAIDKMLTKSDPQREHFEKARRGAAASLIGLAKVYKARKWYLTSMRVLRRADQINPGSAKAEMAKLRKLKRSLFPKEKRGADSTSTPVAKPTGPEDLMRTFRAKDVFGGGWKRANGVVTSAPVTGETTLVFVGNRHKHRDGEVSLEVKRVDKLGQVAMIFGADEYDSYFIYEIEYPKGGENDVAFAAVYYFADHKLQTLGSARFPMSLKAKLDWHRMAVRIDGRKATLRCRGKTVLQVECPRVPYGNVGMFVNGRGLGKSPVNYRKLHILTPDQLPKKKVAGAGAAKKAEPDLNEKRVVDNVATAEKLIARKKNEKAFLLLLDTKATARKIESEIVRTTMLSAIDGLLRQSNKFLGKHKTYCATSANRWVSAAAAYTKAGWHQTARVLLRRAQSLSPEVAKAPLVANAKAMGPILLKIRGLPPETQVAADNKLLLEWFQEAREPWTESFWQVDENGAGLSGDKAGAASLVSPNRLGKQGTVQVQVKASYTDCDFGVLLGYKSRYSYYYLAVHHHPKRQRTTVRFMTAKGGELKQVGGLQHLKFSKEACEQWMTVRLRYVPGQLHVKIGDAKEFAIKVKDADFAGQLGLMAAVRDSLEPVTFRNLVIKKAPKVTEPKK